MLKATINSEGYQGNPQDSGCVDGIKQWSGENSNAQELLETSQKRMVINCHASTFKDDGRSTKMNECQVTWDVSSDGRHDKQTTTHCDLLTVIFRLVLYHYKHNIAANSSDGMHDDIFALLVKSCCLCMLFTAARRAGNNYYGSTQPTSTVQTHYCFSCGHRRNCMPHLHAAADSIIHHLAVSYKHALVAR